MKTGKAANGKCNSNRTFVIMFDLFNVDKLNANIRNAFLWNKLNTSEYRN